MLNLSDSSLQDYREFVSPYHYCKNPEYQVKDLLSEVGFDIKDCICSPMSYTMPSKKVLYGKCVRHPTIYQRIRLNFGRLEIIHCN